MKRVLVLLVVAAVMMMASAMAAFAQGSGGGGKADQCDFDTTVECRGGGGGGGKDVPDGGFGAGYFSYDPNTGEYVFRGGGGVHEGDGFTPGGFGENCTGNWTTGEADCVGSTSH